MIAIRNDISTRLQALFHSGDVSGYILAKLPDGSLKTGWIEQGLLSKGVKGQLRDKHNQESLVIPADRFARLIRDMGDSSSASIVVIGPKGLTKIKFVAMVYGKTSQSIIAFMVQRQSPLEIIQFLLKHGLETKISKIFEEPNLDYVEQLRMDSKEKFVTDLLVLSLPKGITKVTEWIKAVLQEGDSEHITIRQGKSKELPVFSALLTRWLNGLELFREMRSAIASCVFVKNGYVDACFWDSPQRIATFAKITGVGIEEISRKYLVPMWIVPGESIVEQAQTREVVLESKPKPTQRKSPADSKTLRTDDMKRNIESLRKRLDELSISDIEVRLDNLETQIQTKPSSSGIEKVSFDALQTRLSENINRIEMLSKRLLELEKRIKKIGSSR